MKHTKNGKLIVIKGVGHLLTHIPKSNEEFVAHILNFAEKNVGYQKTEESHKIEMESNKEEVVLNQ
jgi:hypothetical protein